MKNIDERLKTKVMEGKFQTKTFNFARKMQPKIAQSQDGPHSIINHVLEYAKRHVI